MSFSDELDRMTADVAAQLDTASITVTTTSGAGAMDANYARAPGTSPSFTVPAHREDLGVEVTGAGKSARRVETIAYDYETAPANALVTFIAQEGDTVTDGGVVRVVSNASDQIDGRVRRLITRRTA